MSNSIIDNSDVVARRTEMEQIIARYPDIDQEQLRSVLRYLRREASSFDQAMVASNAAIEPQYRQLCKDHGLDRLGPWEVGLAITVALALFALLIFAALYTDTGT